MNPSSKIGLPRVARGGAAQAYVERLVDLCGRRPWAVTLLALLFTIVTWGFSTRLELHTDLLELLPRNSPGFQAFERQLGKLGGGATLLVLIESPERDANRRFIDELARRLDEKRARDEQCRRRCTGQECSACPAPLISRVEAGTKELRDFYAQNRWLYLPERELEDADEQIDVAIATQSGLVEDLDADSDDAAPSHASAPDRSRLDRVLDLAEARFASTEVKLNPSPSGYFEAADGQSAGLRIVANSTALGDLSGDRLLREVQGIVQVMNPRSYQPSARVGFAGDVPNSLAERKSLASDALWATSGALLLILAGIALYFRSLSAVCIVALPALVGVGAAYAFATAVYGYVNSTGAFLGAIILGNGINYPIVLLSRYEEFVAAGQAPSRARQTAVWNAFRAELVGAAAGSIAYGSLTVTRFRGFNQFGAIGCVGMVLVWCCTIWLVPALLAIRQRSYERRPQRTSTHTGASGRLGQFIARFSQRQRWPIVGCAAIVFVGFLAMLPRFLADPWEYNFDRMGSRGSKAGGPGAWSVKAERVFGGKSNVSGAAMLADSAQQALEIKQEILRKDRAEQQALIQDVVVVQDFLPGSAAEQQRKRALLERIRGRFTPRVRSALAPTVVARLERLLPDRELHEISADDLPALIQSQFRDRDGRLGTVFYVRYQNHVVLSDGRNLLRMAALTDSVALPDGSRAQTASRATIFAEMIRAMRRDGPLVSLVALCSVSLVVVLATRSLRGAATVIGALLFGVVCLLGQAALFRERLNFLNFIAIPITLGIGCEYPFNVFDRSRLLHGDVANAVSRAGMAVLLCSYTTVIGYGSLLFADSQALQSFGRLAIAGEVACAIAALLLVPATLHILKGRAGVDAVSSAR